MLLAETSLGGGPVSGLPQLTVGKTAGVQPLRLIGTEAVVLADPVSGTAAARRTVLVQPAVFVVRT
ncbi:hypothetical protein [Kordiimonas pumila]|uniref:Uncharacterized protein n=1 Tax=Kordiimonas pumila TaxID=2161677 RepID=A0ABV7D3A4_9PROT|nr:hypothetical protein [Kordiimonas pumila]